jgi:hypothetical protein
VLRHPAGTAKMALPGAPRTPRLPRRIDMQNNSGNFLPVGTLSLGVEQAQVRYRVPLVVSGEHGCCRSDIINCRIVAATA